MDNNLHTALDAFNKVAKIIHAEINQIRQENGRVEWEDGVKLYDRYFEEFNAVALAIETEFPEIWKSAKEIYDGDHRCAVFFLTHAQEGEFDNISPVEYAQRSDEARQSIANYTQGVADGNYL